METDQANESSLNKAKSSLKKTLRRIFIAIVVLIILGIGFVGWSFYAAIYKWQSPAAATVEIEQGLSAQAIAQLLADNGVIRTPRIFSTYVRLRGLGSKVKAGEYEFPEGLNANAVLDMLVKGQVKKYQLQIIEGWTIKDIVKYLSELTFLKDPAIPQEFDRLTHDKAFIDSLGFKDISSLEGYLFPDTYEVLRPKTADEIIKRMVARFREIYTPESAALADKLGQTQQQIVTLASIIEKETGKAEERPLISSVFWNRLKQNMPLQSDPTIIYGIPDFNGNLTREDLDNVANPYNTYTRLGLPPGPICNPGKASIDAALQPATSKYLYFVSKNDGTHIFSENLEDHQRAVAQYQLGRAFATGPAEAPPTGEVEPTPPPGVTAIPPFVAPKGGTVMPPPTPGIMPQGRTVPEIPAPAAPQAATPQAIPGPSMAPAAPVPAPATPVPAPAAPVPAPSAPSAPVAPIAPAVPTSPVPPAAATAPTTPSPAVPAYPPKAVTPSVPAAPVTPTTPSAPPTPAPAVPTTPSTTTPPAPTSPPSSAVTTPPAAPTPAPVPAPAPAPAPISPPPQAATPPPAAPAPQPPAVPSAPATVPPAPAK